ncbi:Cobalt-zinc-cadmium resistance protein CzcA [Candidatus Magnetaquicoccaceae bacterium FCR-1]|uniref:Cobalt-zinc-cadmium resistance protein CzcA n=1 Tax=Candidatus Magnetaquiglobus chichijimensis TaxID=3141448 RepID=A0ABQ0C4P2_9PROT
MNEREFNLSTWAVTHRSMVLFLILATLLTGVFSYLRLGRAEDPIFNVPMMTASMVWPGATTREVQDQVMNRLERKLRELEGYDFIKTFSRPGYGALSLRMSGRMTKARLDETWYQARKKINDARQEFPEGVLGPFFNDEYNDVYLSLHALHGDGLSLTELRELAEGVQREIQSIAEVNKVHVLGTQPEKIFVEISSRKLAGLGISPQTLIDTLKRQNQLNPSGFAETPGDRLFMRVDGVARDATDIGEIPIEAGGHLLRLKDIAEIKPGYEDPPSFVIRHNARQVVVIAITMNRHANILDLGQRIDARMASIQAGLPAGVTLEKYADQPRVVAESIWEFEKSFLEALAIVLAVSFFALGRGAGIVVAASVPLVLGMVLVVMHAFDWNLDRISLGSLIIALGLLVDDAIIAVEMMVVKMEQGWERERAASFAYTSTAFPMLTGTLVTVAGFLPVGFAQSIAGEYACGIFWIVGVALLASWLVAVLFTPYLGVLLLPKIKPGATHADPHASPLHDRLRRLLDLCLTHRKKILLATLLLFLAAGAGMGQVQQQFFPTAARPELLVELRLKEGSSMAATEALVFRMENILKNTPDIPYFTAYLGAGSPRFYLSLEPELPNPGYAQFVLMTTGSEARERIRTELMALFDKEEAFPEARGRVTRLEFGPPVGFPVQFRVIGPDPGEVKRIAARVRDQVRASPLVRDTQLNWNDQVRVQKIRVDQEKARQLGIASTDVSNALQLLFSGVPVAQLRHGETLTEVVVRAEAAERQAIDQLEDLPLPARSGDLVPLSHLAAIEPGFEEPVLWRWNRAMAVSVRADVIDGVQAPHATERIWPTLQAIRDSLPPGYRIEQGGAIEESEKANRALFALFPVMFLVMLFFLMMQLQSFSRMGMVFLTAPLGLIGVVPALLLFQAPFGFVALLGVIALGGMIMRNSVILVDQIQHEIEAGLDPWRAIIEATVRRARPVILTAAAAILAMIPLTRSIFWGPMAISIMGGLVVATALTLVFLPALYAAWFGVKRQE